jgi:hypothetical protein
VVDATGVEEGTIDGVIVGVCVGGGVMGSVCFTGVGIGVGLDIVLGVCSPIELSAAPILVGDDAFAIVLVVLFAIEVFVNTVLSLMNGSVDCE